MAGVTPVVVLTKADLCGDPAARLAQVQALLPPQAAVVAVNALDAATREALSPWLQPGQTLVLLGSSGTGKSTLTNTLSGRDVAVTGANRADDSRGRHTTTVRSLLPLPGGACVIDTPGLRALRLDLDDAGQLADAFGDVARLAPLCRFRDCQHQQEPGCAVRLAVDMPRLENYHKLLRESRRDTLTALERQAQQALWKQRGRAGAARAKARRQPGA